MLVRVFSCAIIGLDGVVVEFSVDIGGGLPGITIVWLSFGKLPVSVQTDFREIKGQENFKRALDVAAAGGHNAITSWTTDISIQPDNGRYSFLRSWISTYNYPCKKIDRVLTLDYPSNHP